MSVTNELDKKEVVLESFTTSLTLVLFVSLELNPQS